MSVLLLVVPDNFQKSDRYTVATWEMSIWKLRMWVAIENMKTNICKQTDKGASLERWS